MYVTVNVCLTISNLRAILYGKDSVEVIIDPTHYGRTSWHPRVHVSLGFTRKQKKLHKECIALSKPYTIVLTGGQLNHNKNRLSSQQLYLFRGLWLSHDEANKQKLREERNEQLELELYGPGVICTGLIDSDTD